VRLRSQVLLWSTLILAAASAFGPRSTPAYAQPCFITARVINAETGMPVTGVRWATYRWDEEISGWGLESWSSVTPEGSLAGSASWSPTSRSALLYLRGGEGYYDEYFDGVRAISDPWLPTWVPGGISADASDVASATKITTSPWGQVDLGTISLTPRPHPYGAISGRVTDSLTGVGVTGCTVIAYRYDEATGNWVEAASDPYPDDFGGYTLVGTADSPLIGTIRLLVQPAFPGGADTWWPGVSTIEEARDLYIEPGGTVYGVDQALTTTGRLGGKVLDAHTGRPIEGATVRLYREEPDGYGGHSWSDLSLSHTDENGAWVASEQYYGYEPNIYRVGVDAEESYPQTFYGQTMSVDTARDVILEEGRNAFDLDILLSHGPALGGRAVDASGNAVPDTLVTAYRRQADGTWQAAGQDYTDDSGRYSVGCPSSGTYTVRFTDRAGTASYADDSSTFYGGARSIAQARRVWVPSTKAAALAGSSVRPKTNVRARRAAGGNAYSMAISSSRANFRSRETSYAVLVSDASVYDGLSASGLAGALHGPILYTKASSLSPELIAELDRLGVKRIYAVGARSAIPDTQLGLLTALGFTVSRISGADRYATSAAVTATMARLGLVGQNTPAFVVRGNVTSDALSVASAAYALGRPVLFIKPTGTPWSVSASVRRLGLKRSYLIGGGEVLPWDAAAGLRAAGMTTNRISGGDDAYAVATAFAAAAQSRGWLSPAKVGLLSTSDAYSGLIGGVAMGRGRGLVFQVARTSLPQATANAITARTTAIQRIGLYAPHRAVSSSVLLAAGSR